MNDSLAKFIAFMVIFALFTGAALAIDAARDLPNPHQVEGTVVNRYTKRFDRDSDRYMVEVQTADGIIHPLQVRDSLIRGQFHSADQFAQLQPGSEVDLRVAGLRLAFFSVFPRVDRIDRVHRAK
jgi:hypothetical protein